MGGRLFGGADHSRTSDYRDELRRWLQAVSGSVGSQGRGDNVPAVRVGSDQKLKLLVDTTAKGDPPYREIALEHGCRGERPAYAAVSALECVSCVSCVSDGYAADTPFNKPSHSTPTVASTGERDFVSELILIIRLPVRPSRVNAISMPTLRRNV
jgi:hypothetical protein